MTAPRYVVHLLPTVAVPAALAGGARLDAADRTTYSPESLAAEGFIHCSSVAQALSTANLYLSSFPAVSVLVLDTAHPGLRVATADVAGGPRRYLDDGVAKATDAVDLVWEPAVVPPGSAPAKASAGPRDGDFPHIYGPMPLAAVAAVLSLRREEGKWVAIDGIEQYA
ncbi:hypothetical protein H9P43_007712 [Blastocladiella emersonii ATCC 22665]|nr:hypothetical protein H9P43_007712 [Blastocladiella emersonii ATCC 22665]